MEEADKNKAIESKTEVGQGSGEDQYPDGNEDMEDDKQDNGDEDLNAIINEKLEVAQFDTTEEFFEVFGQKLEFDSWEEFTNLLEEFQTKTGTYYKPRSACSVDYANERRISGPIDERFVYSNVKMICVHFGTSQKRGAGQRRNYVGKGCGAFLNVSYNKGALRITSSHLIHNNHGPAVETEVPLRQLRVFNFNEELDLVICREVMRANPFVFSNGEKQWIQAVDRLKEDERFADITPRLIKKRIRFLVDKFMAITHGRRPPAEDEMGCILYELDRTRKEKIDNPLGAAKKKRGRPRKKRVVSEEEDFADDFIPDSPPEVIPRKKMRSSPTSSHTSSEVSILLAYLQKKDEEDRTLRQKEIELRREELSFQKQRFEFEKIERKAHLDLLKAQVQAFEQSVSSKQVAAIAPKDGNQVEYTIVVDNNNQVLNPLPTLG